MGILAQVCDPFPGCQQPRDIATGVLLGLGPGTGSPPTQRPERWRWVRGTKEPGRGSRGRDKSATV